MKLSASDFERLRRFYWMYKDLEREPRMSQQLGEIKMVRDPLEKAHYAWRKLSDESKSAIAYMQHVTGGPWNCELEPVDGPDGLPVAVVPIDKIVSRMERAHSDLYEAVDLAAESYVDSGGRRPKQVLRYFISELCRLWEEAGERAAYSHYNQSPFENFVRDILRQIDPEALKEKKPDKRWDSVHTVLEEVLKKHRT